MKLKQLIFLSILIGNSCSSQKQNTKEIETIVASFSKEIESSSFSRIENITTKRGFESILQWSDSLKNEQFLNKLSLNLRDFNVFEVTDYDSVIVLSLGKPDPIVGATGGYVFLKSESSSYKIDLYRGGK